MKVEALNGYEIRFAKPSGGKAGKGLNKTSTVQVVKDCMILKSFRFSLMGGNLAKIQAITKARAFIHATSFTL